MRIINTTTNEITFTDIDRGIEKDREIYESWNGKADNVVPASISTTGYIDILDTDRVMLSTEMGQIGKFKTAGKIVTAYSITGRNVGPFAINGSNNNFLVQVGTDPVQSFTLPSGSAVSMGDIVTAITLTATGFTAEESNRFFRSSNTDRIISDHMEVIQSAGGYGYGQRGTSIMSGFLVLWGGSKITIGSGSANDVLGFTTGAYTKAM